MNTTVSLFYELQGSLTQMLIVARNKKCNILSNLFANISYSSLFQARLQVGLLSDGPLSLALF